MIELFGIQKSYGERLALDVPAFSFEDGGRYVLVGPNGSGKTSLCAILRGRSPTRVAYATVTSKRA